MRTLTLLCLAAVLSTAAAAAGPLDGRSIAVAFSEGDQAMDQDHLVFAEGKLGLPGCEKQFGFGSAAYTAKPAAKGKAAFEAVLTSAKHGNLAVTGLITEDGTVEGTRTWSKPGKDPIVHTFRSK